MVIAHRLSSIRDVDRIHVLDAGRIVESGRYEHLMERNGVFTDGRIPVSDLSTEMCIILPFSGDLRAASP